MAPTKPESSYPTHKDVFSPILTGGKKATGITAHPHCPKVDLDKHCGVASDGNGSPCLKPLRDCQTHSKIQKRAVAGRTPLPKVDLDKQCGVAVAGSPCPKFLRNCQTHSRVQKRAVVGRSCSYDMLIVAPAWTAASRLAEPAVDNGEGSGKDWQRVKNQIEKERATGRGKTPRVEILVSVIRGKGKGKTASEGSDEDGSDVELPVRPKGKKRGPKAWTALENEVAREIREYAGHQLPTIEYLEIARKIVKKVRGWEA